MEKWNYENDQWIKLPAHLKHLPLFTRHFDLMSWFFRLGWRFILNKIIFKFYIRLKVIGDFKKIHNEHPKLLLISNHASHLDAVAIAAAVPFKFWLDLYITAAKDYWFANPWFTFFSKHCLGAIPIDRKDTRGEAIRLCVNLLKKLDKIWLILFPEGTRSQDGYIQDFKRGVSIFSMRSKVPILFLYLQGNAKLMPKGSFPQPGTLRLFIGPIHPPAKIEVINSAYKEWVLGIDPDAYRSQDDNLDI